MSACFYDIGGFMVSVSDLHTYIAFPTTPMPYTFHLAAMTFLSPVRTGEIDTVTSEGRKMAKQGFKLYLIPQNPVPPAAPDPREAIMLAILLATSKSTAYLSRSTVTHGGTPLACCVASMIGLNSNCGYGAGWVINPNSVVTTPSVGDFAGAMVGWALDKLAGVFLSKGLPNDYFVKPIISFITNLTTKKIFVSPTIKFVRKQVQEIVDELL